MKSYRRITHRGRRLAISARRFARYRPGTVIIIVLALLGMLALIALFALGFTAQENQSATYFAGAAKVNVGSGIDPDAFFNDILRQIIIGPAINEKQSVMWGGTHSLLPTMFGRDMAPFSGQGVNLIWNSTLNQPTVDQNYDGMPDDGTGTQFDYRSMGLLNYSPSAAVAWQPNTAYFAGAFVSPASGATGLLYVATTAGTSGASQPAWPTSAGSTVPDGAGALTWKAATSLDLNSFPIAGTPFPDPDTNITYPDINSNFLASDTLVPNGTNYPIRVITPSFHRPMLLRSLAPSQWYTLPATAPYVMYPHVAHVAIDSSGNVTTTPRYVTGTRPDNSGIGTPLYPFPIPGDIADTTPVTSAQPAPQEGVWTPSGTFNPAAPPAISYDVDTDNDGIPDARYMDFGFPMMQDANGNQFVALGVAKIIDADSLFNLNVHGNRAALAHLPVPNNFAGGNNPAFISQSDHGISASEVNPEWALNARPLATTSTFTNPDFSGNATALSAALQQYTLFFRPGGSGSNPTNNFDSSQTATYGAVSYELANMEWWNLLNGRPQLTAGTPPTVSGSSFVGRWGENASRLDPNVVSILAGNTLSAGVGIATDPFPLPGTSGVDDNNNSPEGGNFIDAQNVFHPAFVQPVDFFSAGTWIDYTASDPLAPPQGKRRLLFPRTTTGTVAGSEQFPQYSQFWINCTFPAPNPAIQWAQFFLGALNGQGNFTGKLMADISGNPSGGVKSLVDEPDETVTEPSAAAQQPNDNIFGASENTIQLSGGDFSALGNPGRTASLMPFNFVSNARAALIRQRFTSTSWDLKSFGKEFFGAYNGSTNDVRRLWEYTDTSGPPATGAGPFRFPPNFGPSGSPIAPLLPPYNTPAVTSSTNQPIYPLRLPVANLLQVLTNPNLSSNPASGPYVTTTGTVPETNLVLPQRLLSANGLTEQYQSGTDSTGHPIYTFRFRPLTPHPSTGVSTFANTQITYFPTATASKTLPSVPWIAEPEQLTAGNLQQQEWLARYDRQRMARDIYTLLYLMGGGSETLNYASNGTASISNEPGVGGTPGVRPLYTEDQLQEMAQFAVNTVDALDPDSNITVFEYDKNLADGWNLDDNAYDGSDAIPAGDRGVVYGVERQQLCLNEAMVAFSQQCINTVTNMAAQHPDVQWDTTKQWSFLYLELENVGPTAVTFQNQSWQIAIKQSPAPTSSTATSGPIPSTSYGGNTAYPSSGQSGEMRLIFNYNSTNNSGQPPVAAGVNTGGTSQRLTIGGMVGSSDGLNYNVPNLNPAASPAAPYPSYMVIDPNDLDPVYAGTVYDNHTGTPAVPVGFPIAPRAAFVAPTAAPFANTAALNLDLAQPQTNPTVPYYIVPPGGSTPPASQTSWVLGSAGDGQSVAAPVPTLGAGTQMLQFHDPYTVGTPGLINLTTPITLRVELRRRADPNRLPPVIPTDPTSEASNLQQALDNPWVVVDYMDVPVGKLVLKMTGAPGNTDLSLQIQAQLGDLLDPGPVSTERSQPLYHDIAINPVNYATISPYPRNGGVSTCKKPLWQGNSLGQDNDAAGYNPGTVPATTSPTIPPSPVVPTLIAPHPLYQPHYDRDFTSVGELFNIPLYGPYGPNGPLTPTTLNNVYSSGSSMSLSSGLTHLMASRVTESGTTLAAGITPELLVGADYVPSDPSVSPKQPHYVGYGTAGFRLQHPEGGDQTQANPATDFTENRWFRLLGFVEVPTRSHRGLEEAAGIQGYQINAGTINGSPGFYRTPGKINVNTLRYPDIVAGLVGESDIFNMNFTAALPSGQNLPAGLQVPYLLQDATQTTANPDNVAVPPAQNPTVAGPVPRDWWEQFIATRDGVDPLPTSSGGTGLSLSGLPRSVPPTIANGIPPTGSHPFHGLGFSAYGGVDPNGYNGQLESTVLRALSGDTVTTPAPGTFDMRRRLFELGTYVEHTGSNPATYLPLDYATKQRLLSRLIGNTTTRSNVFFVWIQVDFFQAKDVGPSLSPLDTGVVRIGAKLGSPGVPGTSPAYRGFFVIDRSQALPLVTPQYLPTTTTGQPFVFSFNQSFNWQSLVLYQQRIQ